jgi:hypothetical protein
VARRASIACRGELSDEEVEALRAEYDAWIQRDPDVREPLFEQQVERARARIKRLSERKKLLAEQLRPLREVLSIWQALFGVSLVSRDDDSITPLGWAITLLAAFAPVAALQALSWSSQRALSTVLDAGRASSAGSWGSSEL